MNKIDVIFKIVMIILGLPLLFVSTDNLISEYVFSIYVIKTGILFLISYSIYKLYKYD